MRRGRECCRRQRLHRGGGGALRRPRGARVVGFLGTRGQQPVRTGSVSQGQGLATTEVGAIVPQSLHQGEVKPSGARRSGKDLPERDAPEQDVASRPAKLARAGGREGHDDAAGNVGDRGIDLAGNRGGHELGMEMMTTTSSVWLRKSWGCRSSAFSSTF